MNRGFNSNINYDNEIEIVNEFQPDPFSEEPHSHIHPTKMRTKKNDKNSRNAEKKRDILRWFAFSAHSGQQFDLYWPWLSLTKRL